LNDASPHWRTFSSVGPAEDSNADQTPVSTAQEGPGTISRVTLLVAVLGGLAAGAALVMMAALAVGWSPAAGPGGSPVDEPSVSSGSLDTLAGAGAIGLTGVADLSAGAPAETIVVDVGGAVARPGLHRLRVGDRVGDAIEAAGGFAPRVDLAATDRSLNLAQPLSDGAKVLVPELGMEGPRAVAADSRIDVNTADQAALESLPGIGPVTAAKIMEARSQQPFASVGDLLARGVVGQAVFEDIEDLVRTSG